MCVSICRPACGSWPPGAGPADEQSWEPPGGYQSVSSPSLWAHCAAASQSLPRCPDTQTIVSWSACSLACGWRLRCRCGAVWGRTAATSLSSPRYQSEKRPTWAISSCWTLVWRSSAAAGRKQRKGDNVSRRGTPKTHGWEGEEEKCAGESGGKQLLKSVGESEGKRELWVGCLMTWAALNARERWVYSYWFILYSWLIVFVFKIGIVYLY